MKYLIFIFFLIATVAFAQYNPGLPLPGLPKSVGPKPMSGSTSVTFATDQSPITITASTPITVTTAGKIAVTKVRNNYLTTTGGTNVTTGSYLQLVSSMPSPVTEIEVFDSSGQTLAFAFGAPGSEVQQIFDYPGGNGRTPLAVPQGTRFSVTAITGTANSGELDINFYE